MRKRGLGIAIPQQLGIEMRVRIDKTGSDYLACSINLAAACLFDTSNLCDAPCMHGNIRVEGGHSGAVDDASIANNQIVHVLSSS
jgi:hypothetical protein